VIFCGCTARTLLTEEEDLEGLAGGPRLRRLALGCGSVVTLLFLSAD